MSSELVDTKFFSDANLKAYYRFNNGALTTDSKNSYTLTNNNTTPGTSDGKFDYGVDFTSNTNKSLSIESNLGITSQVFSISTWIKGPSPSTYQIVSRLFDNTTKTLRSFEYNNDGAKIYLSFGIFNGTLFPQTNYTTTLSTTNYSHVVATCDGTTITLYLNGQSVATDVAPANGTGAQPDRLIIGNYATDGAYPFSGKLDDFAIFDKTLSAAEVLEMYQTNFDIVNSKANIFPASLDRNAVSMLHFNGTDTSTSIIDDTSKVWTALGDAQLDTADYKFPTASLLLDGTGDSIDTPNHQDFDFGTGDWTIEGWIKRNGTVAYAGVMGSLIADYSGVGIGTSASGDRLSMTSKWSGTILNDIIASSTFADQTWTHIALVRYGNTINLYQNGTSVGSTNCTEWVCNSAGQGFCIGRAFVSDTVNYLFKGWYDEVRISKGTARWTTNFTPSTTQYYSFVTYSKDQSSKASIVVTSTDDNSTKSNIVITNNKLESTKSNILVRDNKNNSSTKASVVTTNSNSQSIKSSIVVTNTTGNNTKSSVVATKTSNNNVKSDIKSTLTDNNSSKTNILVTTSNQSSVKTDILRVNETKNNSIKSSIVVTNNFSQNTKSDILSTTSKDNNTKSSIVVKSTYPQSVKLNILVTNNTKDSNSKASIVVTSLYNNSVKSNIIHFYDQSAKSNIITLNADNHSVKIDVKTTYYCGCSYDWKLSTDPTGQNRGAQ